MKLYALMALFAIFSGSIFAQEDDQSIYKEGQVVCPDNKDGIDFGYCTYTLRHLVRVQELIRKVEQVIFKGDPLTSPAGMMEPLGNNQKVLTFWHIDKLILEKMKAVIPMLDTRESFSPNTIVEFKTDIYEISETGLRNLGAEISNLRLGLGGSDSDHSASIDMQSQGISLDLKLGYLELSGLLSAERQKGHLRKKITISRPVANFSSITYRDKTQRYPAPGAGTSVMKEDITGVTLDGVVSVNDNDPSLVTIKNFKLVYGTLNDDNTVNMLTLPAEDLILKEGIAFPLVSSKTVGTFRFTSTRLLGLQKQTKEEDAKLLVYVSVQVKTWDDYINSIQDLLSMTRQKFSNDELGDLPETCVSNLELLKNIVPLATRDQNGDPILSIKLNSDFACKSNIKKRIQVTFTGENIPKTENIKNITVESLMHIPLKINGIALKKLRENILDFKVKLEMKDAHHKTKVTHKLKFAPTDFDIGDNFWLE